MEDNKISNKRVHDIEMNMKAYGNNIAAMRTELGKKLSQDD